MSRLWPLRLHRITGRSHGFRRADAWVRRRLAAVRGAAHPALPALPSLLQGAPAAEAAAGLVSVGYHLGYRLAGSAVEALRTFAAATPCTHAAGDGERFLFGEVTDGRTPGGQPVAVADVDLSGPCPVVQAVALDALLVEVATLYLGYPPTKVIPRLFWSPAARLSDELRRRDAQTIDFHYDIDPSRTLYAFFYLTPTGPGTGAHVVLPATHGRKPVAIVLESTFQSAERLRELYPGVEPLVIEGEPGFGFLEDPSCFHRALPPRDADRLCLQLRYS